MRSSQSYTSNDSLYTYDFVLPMQIQRMPKVKNYCLNATYSISKRADDILYSIVTGYEQLGRDFPCGYMITNDHSIGPIVQWLAYLKENSVIVDPLQFTIDCSDAETNAIRNVFLVARSSIACFMSAKLGIASWQRRLSLKKRLLTTVF